MVRMPALPREDAVMTPFHSRDVALLFDDCPNGVRESMLALRELLFQTAQETKDAGQLEESLKWGQPSYQTVRPKSGTPIRLGWSDKTALECSLFFHCQTNLIATFRDLYPDTFHYDGNRQLSFSAARPMSVEPLKHCMALAMTYHHRKRLYVA